MTVININKIKQSIKALIRPAKTPNMMFNSSVIGGKRRNIKTPKGNVYLVNITNLPTPGTHYFTSRKFLRGFEYSGYRMVEIRNDLKEIENSSSSIVMLNNHGLVNNFQNALHDIEYLATAKQEVTYLCWFFHQFIFDNQLQIPFKKWILTGEHFRKEPTESLFHRKCWELQSNLENYVPLTFSADIFPDKVGLLVRKPIFDAQFVGNGYKLDWTSKLKDCYIRNTPPFISENERIDSYLQSHMSLGFHSNSNISNHCVAERIPEGMAYGCVVLTDQQVATVETEGIVEFVGSFEELVDKMHFYVNNERARNEKQLRGYSYVKTKGCYVHVAERFLKKMQQLEFIR